MILISILTLLATFIYGILFFLFIIGWNRIKAYTPVTIKNDFKTTISVIIPSRNEELNIINCLKKILLQDYPKNLYEVIIANDHSEDSTYEIVNRFISINQLSNFKIYNINGVGKKAAIKESINIASGQLIVTTDADCVMGKSWLTNLASYYEEKQVKMICGPVVFHEETGFFKQIQSLEFAGLIGIGAASLKLNMPNMCNGANLCYLKKVFEEVNGYVGVEHIASGDDEFLMHKIAKKYPGEVHFIKSQAAIVNTHAVESFYRFIQQRRRWASKGGKYNNRYANFIAWIVFIFNLLFLINLIKSIFYPIDGIFCIQIIIKFLLEFIFLFSVTLFFKKEKYLIWFIPAQILHVFYVVFIALWAVRGTYEWKGRKAV